MKASERFDPATAARSASASAASTSARYCGCCAAFNSSDGLVVASCGVNCRIDSMSPVSATTVVNFFKESSRDMQLRRSEEHTSELQSQSNLVCRLLLEKKKT